MLLICVSLVGAGDRCDAVSDSKAGPSFEIAALRRFAGLRLWMDETASPGGSSYSFELLWTTEGDPVGLEPCVGPHLSAMRLMIERTSRNRRVPDLSCACNTLANWRP